MKFIKAKIAALKLFWKHLFVALDQPVCNPAWQIGHFLAGALAPALFYVAGRTFLDLAMGVAFILIVWALPKEFLWDIKVEHATIKGGIDDWLHYAAGSVLTLLVYGIAAIVRAL